MTGQGAGNLPGTWTRAPRTDSGWAWVVECGAFVVCFASMGYNTSLSVYLNIWMDYFETSAVTAGLVMSMMTLVRGVMSPIAGALCSRFGPRLVTMVGGVIYVTGFVMSSQAPSIEFLIVGTGLVGATGLSMVYIGALNALGMYFKKRFALAVGLASAGISVGQLASPPLVTHLIDSYGWQGSMLITAAVVLHTLAAGALFRPTARKARRRRRDSGPAQMTGSLARARDGVASHRDIGDTTVSDEDQTEDAEENYDTMILVKNCPGTVAKGTQHLVVSTSDDGGSSVAFTAPTSSARQRGYISRLKHFVLHTYGLRRLAHNSSYRLTLVAAFLHGFSRLGVAYIVPRAESVGIDMDGAAFLLSIFGIGSFVGRIGHGWFIDKGYITGEMAYALSLAVLCVAVSLMPAFADFIPLAILALLMGSMAGMSSSVVMVVVRAQVHRSDASEALGIMLLFASVGNVLGIFVAGVAYDNTESYDIAFFVGGGFLLMASLICVLVRFRQKAAQRSRSRVDLPTAYYVKLPRKAASDSPGPGQAEALVTVMGPGSAPDGVYSDDAGITNPLFMLGLSGDPSPDEDVARTSGEDREVVKGHHSMRRRLLQKVEDDDDMGGIENPLAVNLSDELGGGTVTEAAADESTNF